MVGADRFDEAGERASAPPNDGALRTVPDEPADDSYWSQIDYPEPRPMPAGAPRTSVASRRRTTGRGLTAAVVALLLVVGGGAYAVGRANGHAPVPGLHRQVDAQQATLQRRAATIARQARALAADEARLRSLRAQVSQSATAQAACRTAIEVADRAFGTESDALQALAGEDFATANTLTDRFGAELDEYAGAKAGCLGSTTAV
jgi:hypothetical protein